MTQNTSPRDGETASQRLVEAFSPATIDALLKEAKSAGTPIDGVDGLLNQMTKAVLERALQAEMTDHLGYDAGDPSGHGSGNSRNGRSRKTVSTRNGPVDIEVPRDRNASFEPTIVPKRSRRIGNIDDMILSLYSRGMTTRDIEAHLLEVYGVNASRELISNVTDVVVDEIKAWQSRPLDEAYPILYVDGIRIRVKDNGVVTTKVAYLAIGVDIDGRKHALGCWIQDTEGAKFWQKVLSDLRNRGVRDILIACCDGLTGLPDAIHAVFAETVVQTCVVHVIRNAMRFVSYGDRAGGRQGDERDLYRPHRGSRRARPDRVRQTVRQPIPRRGRRVAQRLDRIHPLPGLSAGTPQIVYTTNAIESINFQLRKITKNRGHFPDKDAAMKLLYLGLRNISSQRGGESGTGTHGWKVALNTLINLFPGRIHF